MVVSVSNEQPTSYAVQEHPQRPGWAIVTLRDAAVQQIDGSWCCNEYARDVPDSPDLRERVSENPQAWLDNLRTCDPAYEVRKNAEETINDLDAAIVDYAYQNALLTLGLSEV